VTLAEDDPVPVALVRAVRAGDLAALERLLAENPGLASARIGRPGKTRTLLHVATDWPGYFPEGPAVTRMLLHAGADPDARTEGGTVPETPLHWAASSDDVDVAEALIDGGADIEAPCGSISTPLGNASGTAAGTSHARWWSATPGWTRCGRLPRWACCPACRN
jgi:ankyrin repeat protein